MRFDTSRPFLTNSGKLNHTVDVAKMLPGKQCNDVMSAVSERASRANAVRRRAWDFRGMTRRMEGRKNGKGGLITTNGVQ